jgi:uncharacterized protein
MATPFHTGELRMQQLTGETWAAEGNAPMIMPRIAKGAVPFLAQRSLAILSLEHQGKIWALSITGEPGFVSVSDPTTLRFDLQKIYGAIDPMILEAAAMGAAAGTLFIDLSTRMRYRMNGTLAQPSPQTIELQVREAYGNCPKYITRRAIDWDSKSDEHQAPQHGELLPEIQQKTLARADLFFLATGHPERGMDASHRGGNPGFITVEDNKTIHFPDYPGNSLYNSLGNLLVDNRIGLLVPDLERRRLLRITGTARVDFQDATHTLTTSDAPRLVKVTISRWDEVNLPVQSSRLVDYSPYNP